MSVLHDVTSWFVKERNPKDTNKNIKKIEYNKEKEVKRKKCLHDPNSTCSCCTTLNLVPRRVMTYPPVYQFVCSECGKSFQYTQDDNGDYIPYSPS